MADDGPTIARPEAFWGSILASARQRATTAEVWNAIHAAAESSGLAIPSDMFSQVNRMRSLAVGLRRASDTLGGAASTDALTGDMIGRQIYARSGPEQSLAPLFHVRFEMKAIAEGVESTGWYTLQYSGSLPDTVGELEDDIDLYASNLAEGYGVSLVGTGAVEIGAW